MVGNEVDINEFVNSSIVPEEQGPPIKP